MPTTPLPRLIALGRTFFALGVLSVGLQLVGGKFVMRILPPVPAQFPTATAGASVSGAVLIVTATGLLCGIQARRAAGTLAACVLLSAGPIAVPDVLAHLGSAISWANMGKVFALGGGGLIAAATFPIERHSPVDRVFILLGRMLLGGCFALCGVEHFLQAQTVLLLVPGWIGAAVFWTYFAGVAFLLAAAGLFFCVFAEWAALLAGVMIFAWFFLLHLPRAMAHWHDASESTACFEALALAGICFMLAGRLWHRRDERVNVSPSATTGTARRAAG